MEISTPQAPQAPSPNSPFVAAIQGDQPGLTEFGLRKQAHWLDMGWGG